MRKRTVFMLAAAAVLALVAGSAIAGNMTSGVKSYTGCLTPGEGVLIKIKEGNAPSSACTGGQVQVHFSGGDITAISAQTGGGLTGGGENGSVSLSIRRDCGNGQVVKWNGSAWACADDSNSTYSAGTGLDLSSGGEFSVKEGYRLPQTCASGEAATRNPEVGGGAGTWICDQYATADQSCASGQFAKGITGVGALSCAAAGGGALPFFEARTAGGAGIPDDGVMRTHLTLELPAGRYILVSTGVLASEDNFDNDSVTARCTVSKGLGGVVVTSAEAFGLAWDRLDLVPTTGEPITVRCAADDGADGASLTSADLQAVKVG